jgi:ABC-type transport system substrate-binding protein
LGDAGHFWYNPNIAVYKHDVAKAKALLDEMNLKDTNGDGVSELDGKPLQYDLVFAAHR